MAAPIQTHAESKHLVVVDPEIDAYRCLSEMAEDGRLRLTMTSAGRNALRLAPSFADAVWLVSPQLPDMSGLDLVEMLHSLQPRLRAVVIDNGYDRGRELEALRLRAIQYVCKPMHPAWLASWHSPLPRAPCREKATQRMNPNTKLPFPHSGARS